METQSSCGRLRLLHIELGVLTYTAIGRYNLKLIIFFHKHRLYIYIIMINRTWQISCSDIVRM